MDDNVAYWDKFYGSQVVAAPQSPSQFAAFVLNDLPDVRSVIELGCGNGRDAEFFAGHGLTVLALDASVAAIRLGEMRKRYRNLQFHVFVLGKKDALPGGVVVRSGDPMVLYARFFLHAINEVEEAEFFDLAGRVVPIGSYIALEYRVLEDAYQGKVFGNHYRRYIDHSGVLRTLREDQFEVLYEVVGRGFAKHKSEDALVGRCIAVRAGR